MCLKCAFSFVLAIFLLLQWSEIDKYPSVLTLHLKRFDFDYIQMRYKKNECNLDVPLSLPPSTFNEVSLINHHTKYKLLLKINTK